MDDQTPSPDPRLADAEFLRSPQARDLIRRADRLLTEARACMAEFHRITGADADDGAGPGDAAHVIIRKDPGRTMRAKLNAADRPDEGLPS